MSEIHTLNMQLYDYSKSQDHFINQTFTFQTLSAVNTTYSILTSKESTWHIYDPLRYVNAIRFLIREKPQLDPRNDYKEESAIL